MSTSLSTVSPAAAVGRHDQAPRPDRQRGIDLLRGLVTVLMVIDHVRWFLSDARFDPTDPTRTTAALFFTRWVTHFCAPVFMLLAGAGAWLGLGRGRSRAELSWYLATRGLWLVLLEFTVARLGWQFNLDYGYSAALVFWALGWSMVALAALVRLPLPTVAVLGIGMIALHNLADGIEPASWGSLSWLWTILHAPGDLEPLPGVRLFILYPLVPWIGVMATGYCLGPVMALPAERRHRICLRLGLAVTVAFIVVRLLNRYGDPAPWAVVQEAPWRTLLSFLNTTKYPASLLFLLMTLGPAIALLPRLDRARGRIADGLLILGRVPLFFWLLHVPLIHLAALGFSLARYGGVMPWLIGNPPTPLPDGYGYGLPVVYAVTLAVVLVLYPVCRWFAGVKRRRRDAWLSYL